jgi:hypothetical protein
MNLYQSIEARLRERILRRFASRGTDAGVAMLSAILFMIIVAGLGMIIVSTVIGQVAPTFLAQKETQTVYGAQAGMQAALGMFRTAVYKVGGVVQVDPNGNGATLGDPKLLPCGFSGTTNPSGTGDGLGYTVTIQYFDADPTTHISDSTWVSANIFTCTPGSGVAGITSAKPLAFAYLVSTGTGNNLPNTSSTSTFGNRSLGAVYQFKVSTYNVVGGLINDYNDSGNYCLSAVPIAPSLTATAGSTIQWLPKAQCTAANAALQNWSYGSDYEIKLASTTTNGAAGLCITGPVNQTDTNTQNALLQTCVAAGNAGRWNQLWSWYGSNTWQGSVPAINAISGYNLGYTSVTTGGLLEVIHGGGGSFSPTTEVGSGAAGVNQGVNTDEIVNYLEFGRCMDVTNASIGSTSFLISYPCKQDPNKGGDNIEWNQKFYYNEPVPLTSPAAPQAIIVNNYVPGPPASGTPNNTDPTTLPSANQYCMTTPGYPTTKATAGAIVYVYACATTSSYAEWTRVYTANNYGGSYLFTTTTSTGTLLCLEVNPAVTYAGWSELDVAPCVATNLGQKWNAPPNYTPSEVGGYKELGG